jgi:hypothetical protein
VIFVTVLWGRDFSLFATMSRLALGPTQEQRRLLITSSAIIIKIISTAANNNDSTIVSQLVGEKYR